MKLTRDERHRLLSGDYTALRRRERPEIEEGERLVLTWSPARRVIVDRETGETVDFPRRPLLWAELGEPLRHRDGTWRIPLRVHDERTPTRFLGPSPAPSEDSSLSTETERGYVPTVAGAVDHLEAVDDHELRRQAVKSKESWIEHREEMASEEEARRQERAVREQLKRAVRQLGPPAAQALLAAVEQRIERAIDEADG